MIITPEAGILVITLSIIGGIILFIPVLNNILDIASYVYANAKIRALEAGLIRKEKYKELIDSKDEFECLSSLEDSDYGAYLTKISEPITPLKVEVALNQHLKDIYLKILRTIPSSSRKMFESFTKLWDAKNIKTILRSLRVGLSSEEIERSITPIGTLKDTTLKVLLESKTLDEAVSELENTEYGRALNEKLQMVKNDESASLLPFEIALDKYVIENIHRTAATSQDSNAKIFKNLIGIKADILNLKIILKAKSEQLEPNEVEGLLLNVYSKLDPKILKSAIRVENIEEIISALEGTPYAEILAKYLVEYRENGSLFKIENALDNYYLKIARDFSLRNTLGIGPAIRLLIDKEADIKKIRSLIRYKSERMDNSDLEVILGVTQ